ncbi:MAG: hydantoinase B/oxoprolinase family protein [Candidatus Dormibacteraceae bacterium]
MPVDPFTVEVIANTLTSYADEMTLVLQKSAYSTMIRDVRDYCCAIVDLDGKVIAYNTGGLVTHFADIGEHVLDGIQIYGKAGFEPGDAVMMNAEYRCGQHANNVLIYSPVFVAGEIVAFAANRAHWQDIGGITANRPVFGTTEAVQEGLQVRSVKVYSRGEPIQDVIRLIQENLRQPAVSLGDLRAQVGACRVGERSFSELVRKYGLTTIREAVAATWSQSEHLARRAVEDIPDGEYSAEAFLDDDAFHEEYKVPIRIRIVVRDSTLTVDLSGLSDQVMGPINSRTVVPILIAFKAVTTPHRPPDPGCFAPLRIELPEGKLISAVPPAAMGSWSWPFPTIIDTFFKALGPAVPERIPAGTSGAPYGAGFFYGQNPETRRPFLCSDIIPVGWGARPRADGPTSGGMILGPLQDCPIEVTEALNPLRVLQYSLIPNSGGPGHYRGGLGVVREYELLSDSFNNAEIARATCPPWGLLGGGDGQPGYQTIVYTDGSRVDHLHGYMNRHLRRGTRVIVRTSGGGGYGDPLERDRELLEADLRDGYVNAAGVTAYGIDAPDGDSRKRPSDVVGELTHMSQREP